MDDITVNVAKVVWAVAMAGITIYLSNELFFPLLSDIFSANLSFFALTLTLVVCSLFIIAVWGIWGYGTSILATIAGFTLGLIVELIVWCYRKICP